MFKSAHMTGWQVKQAYLAATKKEIKNILSSIKKKTQDKQYQNSGVMYGKMLMKMEIM